MHCPCAAMGIWGRCARSWAGRSPSGASSTGAKVCVCVCVRLRAVGASAWVLRGAARPCARARARAVSGGGIRAWRQAHMHVLRLAEIVSLPPMTIGEVHYNVTEYQVTRRRRRCRPDLNQMLPARRRGSTNSTCGWCNRGGCAAAERAHAAVRSSWGSVAQFSGLHEAAGVAALAVRDPKLLAAPAGSAGPICHRHERAAGARDRGGDGAGRIACFVRFEARSAACSVAFCTSLLL